MPRDSEKSARRTALRARRREIAAARDVAVDGPRIAEHALALLAGLGLGAGAVVTSYEAVPGEPPTAALNAALAAHGIRVLVPITLPDLDLDWRDADVGGPVPTGSPAVRGLGSDAVALADVVLSPGLAVDHHGTRMGQGGGCYDRALPRRRHGAPVVVLLHPGEVVAPGEPALPRREHDQPVDAVLTADGITELTARGLSPSGSTPPAAG